MIKKIPAVLIATILIVSGVLKIAGIHPMLDHFMTMGLSITLVKIFGVAEVAFAFCRLLGFQLLPRLKAIHAQKLYRVEAGQSEAYPNLQAVLTRPIDWQLFRQQ